MSTYFWQYITEAYILQLTAELEFSLLLFFKFKLNLSVAVQTTLMSKTALM